MKTKKILLMVAIISGMLLFFNMNNIFAYTDNKDNDYVMEVNKENESVSKNIDVVTDDEVNVLLKIKVKNGIYSTQGRIKYDTNLTLVDQSINTGNFANESCYSVQTNSEVHAIGYSVAQAEKVEVGDYIIIQMKFKVTGLEAGEYTIEWQDYNKDGYFNIDVSKLTRTDTKVSGSIGDDQSVGDILKEEIEAENKPGTSNENQDGNTQSGNSEFDKEQSENNSNNNDSNQNEEENNEKNKNESSANGNSKPSNESSNGSNSKPSNNKGKDNAQSSNSNKEPEEERKPSLPKTGEGLTYIIVVMSFILIVLGIYTGIRYKKLKF